MPTVLRIGPYRFSFYSIDCAEPQHVHVIRDQMTLKAWLNPIRLERNVGFSPAEVRKVLRLIREHRSFLLEKWNEHCNG